MSVIVLGMEMPECCQDCEGHLVGEWNEYDEMCDTCIFVLSEHPWEPKHKEIDGIDTSKSIPEWCPLRHLPKRHGRLIEAERLRAEFPYPSEGMGGWRNPDEALVHKTTIWAEIDCAETIVEAEGD